MIGEPNRENYGDYRDYALAALGYAIVSSSFCRDHTFRNGGLCGLLRDSVCTVDVPVACPSCGQSDARGGKLEAEGGKQGGSPFVGVDSFVGRESPDLLGAGCGSIPDVGVVHSVAEAGVGTTSVDLKRGKHYARNKARREKAKQAREGPKLVRRDGRWVEASSLESSSTGLGAGLWNSCSAEVRQELIDSKAMMHIAENRRRARVADEEVARMDSPVAIISRAVEMIELAGKCAKKENNSKVAGWAKTVATDYAESIAKSAPSTLRSYASVLSGSGSSTSKSSVSVDGLKRPKPKFDLDFFRVRLAAANGQLEVQDIESGLDRCEITPAQLKYAKALCGAAEQRFIDHGYSYH